MVIKLQFIIKRKKKTINLVSLSRYELDISKPHCLNKGSGVFLMPKNQLNKDELICHVLKLKHEVDVESKIVWQKEKDLAHKYLNRVLDRIQEYRY